LTWRKACGQRTGSSVVSTSEPSLLSAPNQKESSTITFRVPDMTCGRCAFAIGKAIAAVDAGARVEFEIGQHLVRVTPRSSTGADLQCAIEAAGYGVDVSAASSRTRPASSGCDCGCGTRPTVDVHQAIPGATGGCCA
jgi:copper chaperone